jgi:hypothetical protein
LFADGGIAGSSIAVADLFSILFGGFFVRWGQLGSLREELSLKSLKAMLFTFKLIDPVNPGHIRTAKVTKSSLLLLLPQIFFNFDFVLTITLCLEYFSLKNIFGLNTR